MTAPLEHSAEFRFYGALKTLLPEASRSQPIHHEFRGRPSIKDRIETLGVPHTEVAHVLIDGDFASLSRRLVGGERVRVYGADCPPTEQPPRPLNAGPGGQPRFVADVNLGRLARLLRLLGFDTLYSNKYADAEIAAISAAESRILLTRDRRLLMRRMVEYGYFVRSDEPKEQATEVLERFGLKTLTRPFRRCVRCNGRVSAIAKEKVLPQLEPKTRRFYEHFWQCVRCGQVYWEGSHMQGLKKLLNRLESGPRS